jgi:hypothetical protein
MLNSIKSLTKAINAFNEELVAYKATLADVDKMEDYDLASSDFAEAVEEATSTLDELMYELDEMYDSEYGDTEDDADDDGVEAEV